MRTDYFYTMSSPPWPSFLSREGLDFLSGHWMHQHALQPLASRSLAGWAQSSDICWQLFFTCWMLAPGLLVAHIPQRKILLNLLHYSYHWLWSVDISFSFQIPLFFFLKCTKNTHCNVQRPCWSPTGCGCWKGKKQFRAEGPVTRCTWVPNSELSSDFLAWAHFVILNPKVTSNIWKQGIYWVIWYKCLACLKISVLGYIASLSGSMKRNRLGASAGCKRLHAWILIASYVAGWFWSA